jgi:lipoprotein NlpI
MPEAKPQIVLEPHPEPEMVTKLEAKPAPAPSVEDNAKPIPAPISVAKPAPKIAEQTPAKLDDPILPALKTASAYVDRAWTSMDKGLYTQAVADLDHAVALEPAFADAWFARGWAHEKNGNETTALRDYTRATDANPAHAFALFSSGYLHLYAGNAKQAALAFIRARGVATDPALRQYNTLWLYLSRARAGEDARARLQEEVAKEPVNERWPGPLVKFFTGEQHEDLVLAAIDQGTKAQRKERRATGYFFLGIAAEMTGDMARARDYFERTLTTGAVEFRQYDAAKRELEKLNR